MASKSKDAFRTISEVADWLDVPAHVLRFWESKFTQVKPVKRAGGRRYYRPSDMMLLGGIKSMLHDQGLTIRGVQKKLKEDGVDAVSALSPAIDGAADDVLKPVEAAPVVQPDPELEPLEEAPFVDVPETEPVLGGDNVVPLPGTEPVEEPADVEAQPDMFQEPPVAQDEPAPSETLVETEPEPESPPVDVQELEPVVEPQTEQESEPEEPLLETKSIGNVPAPDLDSVGLSQLQRDRLAAMTRLRRHTPEDLQGRDDLAFLEHKARSLRDRMAAALDDGSD